MVQAAEQAQRIRDKRKEQADLEGNVNDMEKAQDFLKAGNVKVFTSCKLVTLCIGFEYGQVLDSYIEQFAWRHLTGQDQLSPPPSPSVL